MNIETDYISFIRKDVKFITIDPNRNHEILVHMNSNDIVVMVDKNIDPEEERRIIHQQWSKHFAK